MRPDPLSTPEVVVPLRRSYDRTRGRLCLVVIGDGFDATYPLPDRGRVAIGRAPESDIRIDHPSVSRNHAFVSIGDTLAVEDLGSRNGTRIGEHRLGLGEAVELALGQPFDVGNVMVVIQQRSLPTHHRHVWAHGYFEARVEEECARAQRSGATFAVIRVRCATPEQGRIVEQALCRVLRAMDVIGYYGPSEHEVLVVDTAPHDLPVVTSKIAAVLEAEGVRASIGLALFPRDARNAYELTAHAAASARGEAPPGASGPIVVADTAIQHLDLVVQRIAAGTISVLITGETGVGKEVLAERIHQLSRRADRPFLRLNCAALTETLLESELFGYEKGAFTGATQAKAGLLETADGGTVLLDELGELPMSIQVKLLRVIEERRVLRVGALRSKAIDVRFLAATHRDLEQEIDRGTFRQDLYFRLNGITLQIPPLRERVAEIPQLAATFLAQAAERNGVPPSPGLTPAALELLSTYAWPGNIRELRNVIERALLLGNGAWIDVEHLPLERMRAAAPAEPAPTADAPAPEPPASDDERARVLDALVRAGGNQTEAAKLLGVSRRTLINRVMQYDLPRPRKKK